MMTGSISTQTLTAHIRTHFSANFLTVKRLIMIVSQKMMIIRNIATTAELMRIVRLNRKFMLIALKNLK